MTVEYDFAVCRDDSENSDIVVAPRFSALWLIWIAALMMLVANGASVSVAEPLNDTAINDTDNYTFTPLDDDGYIIANSSILTLENYTKWSTIGDTVAMSVYAADLDNDGTTELITGGYTNLGTTAELKVWNYAGGKLSLKNLTTWKGWVYSIYVSDVDNDGTPEIVTAGNNAASPAANAQLRVWNYTNSRMNLESSAEWGPSASRPAGAYSIYASDLDGDGTAEIITGGYSNPDYIWSQLRIWNHTGSALNLEASRDWKKGIHALAFSVYASDVNSDGTVEIITSGVVISPTLAQLVVWNYTFGALNNETSVEWGIGYQTNAYSVHASDLDNDGTQEILTGGYIGGTDGYRRAELKIWNYLSSGSLNAELSAQWHLGGKTQVQSVYAVDTGGNGKKDILTLGSFSNGTGYYGQLRVWNWNGSVMFLEKSDDWHESVPVEPGAAESLKAADLDGDGTAEIIAVGSVGAWPGRRAFVRIYSFAPEHPAEVPTHKVAYIPVKYADRPEPAFTIADLEQRAKKVTDYYKQQSFRNVNIGYTFIEKGCNKCWITLDKNFSYFGSPHPKDFDKWDNLRDYAINFSGINTSQYDAIMVVQPENVRAYADPNTGKIIMYQNRTFSTWAHELGHALFKLKDYYSDTDIFRRLLNGGNVGFWDLMGLGDKMNPAAPIASYNRLSAGWLNQTFIGYGEYPIPLLSNMSFGDNVNVHETPFESYAYIFEGRSPPDGVANDTEAALKPKLYPVMLEKDEGILLYLKDKFGKLYTIPHDKTDKTGVTLLPDESYRDDLDTVEFSARKRDSQLYVDIQPYVLINRIIISLLGISSGISNSTIYAEAPQVNASEDYDIHVYTYDGRHVGMNYTSGEYEINIENATSSGNIPGGGPEWISVPDNIKVFYTIDATPARQWAEELNVTLENITATWQVVQYDENGTRKASEPATLNVSLEEPTSIGIAANVDVQPDTLNLKSGGKWITAYVELPKGYGAAKIDSSTVRLNYTIPAENSPKYGFVKNPEIADRDGDGLQELMVKFDRAAVQKMVKQIGTVELVLTGEVSDNNGIPIPFKGSDSVKMVK